MSSPIPEVLTFNSQNNNESPTSSEQVSEIYKENYKKFMDSFSLSNNRVRYYCNKTLSLHQPLKEILDDLVKVQYHVMSFLPPGSETTDHFALSIIFALISKTATLIEWKTLNHDCFWKDFCRETRALKAFVERVQLSTFETVHTVTEKANRAFELLEGVVNLGKKIPDVRLKSSLVQSSGEPSPQGIKVIWMEQMEAIIIQWNDIDEVQSIKLQQTGISFRIRFLRCLLLYARKSLELLLYTMLHTDITMRLEFPFEKLEKCKGITQGQLVPHERSALTKAKRDFDGSLDDILVTVSRFKFQLNQIEEYKTAFKRLHKDPKSCPKLTPSVNSVSVHMEDPLLLKIIGRAISEEMRKESYDFTTYPDRTEDIVAIIEDMWKFDQTSYKKMDQLLILIYTSLANIQPILSTKELDILKNAISDLLIERDRVKRYFKKTLNTFKHNVFTGMSIQQNGYTRPTKATSGLRQTGSNTINDEAEDSESEQEEEQTPFVWVQLQGGYQVTISEEKEFLVLNQFKDQLRFNQLDEDQKVVLTTKMLNRLTHHVAMEGCQAKVTLVRATETKSLVKRLKQKDRASQNFGSIIGNGVYHIQQIMRLMKTMDILRTTLP